MVEASTGAEALRIVAENSPDLVLLDVNLPDIDGFEVCRRLREQLGTLTIPVVHISSTFVNERAQKLAMDGGADGFSPIRWSPRCCSPPCTRSFGCAARRRGCARPGGGGRPRSTRSATASAS